MTSAKRVLAVLRNEKADRVPLHLFAGWNPEVREVVDAAYGHVDHFCSKHHTDIVSAFLPRFPFGRPAANEPMRTLEWYRGKEPVVDPSSPELLNTACDDDLFLTVTEGLKYKKAGFPLLVNVWGIFEMSQFLFEFNNLPGTEEALVNMVAETEAMKKIYGQLAEWAVAAATNAIKAGADIIEISDDWGQQHTVLFNPKLWWELIYPHTKRIVDVARAHDVPVILHSDGDITRLLEGIRQLGVNGLHPVQESAGMSFSKTRELLGSDICIVGGLDTVTATPVMNESDIRKEVQRVFAALKDSGPFIFAGSHMFQIDTELAVIEAAYDEAYKLAAY